jgi:hypothetical protein
MIHFAKIVITKLNFKMASEAPSKTNSEVELNERFAKFWRVSPKMAAKIRSKLDWCDKNALEIGFVASGLVVVAVVAGAIRYVYKKN